MRKNILCCLVWPVLLIHPVIQAQSFKLLSSDVQDISTNGFRLDWSYTAPVKSWVEWGTVSDLEGGTVWVQKESTQQHSWIFDHGAPATFYHVRVGATDGSDTLYSPVQLYTTRSLSSGKIKVYFNHPVNTSVATAQPAIYLDRAIDDTLVAYLNRAQETIDIAIYNSSTSNQIANIAAALNDAHARGVRVRVVYDASSTNSMIGNLSGNIGRIASKTGFSYGIMHNKFVVIDADAEDPDQPLVWTGSTNWSVPQLNSDDNNVIILQDQALARAYKTEFEEMFGSSGALPNATNARFGPDKHDNTPHTFNIGGKTVRLYFSPSDGTNQQIINLVNSANRDMEFASMIITRFDIANAIVARVNTGVTETYGITDDSTASDPAPEVWRVLRDGLWHQRMVSKNGLSHIMHHKFILADHSDPGSDPQVLTGSHNWSNAAEQRNDENTLIVHDHDVVNQYYQAFTALFTQISGRTVGLSDVAPAGEAKAFPNPVQDVLYIELPVDQAHKARWQLNDVSGRVIENINPQPTGNRLSIGTASLLPGIYFLRIEANGSIYRTRFVKQ